MLRSWRAAIIGTAFGLLAGSGPPVTTVGAPVQTQAQSKGATDFAATIMKATGSTSAAVATAAQLNIQSPIEEQPS